MNGNTKHTAKEKRAVKSKRLITAIVTLALMLFTLCGCTTWRKVEDSHYSEADDSLINPNASPEAIKLMKFLKSQYGKKIISGQYISEYEDYSQPQFSQDPDNPDSPTSVFLANEMRAVNSITDDYPVVAGFDVSVVLLDSANYSVEQAIQWHNAGGIVTFCWHWLIDNFDGKARAFYTDETDFDLAKTLKNKDSEQYKGLINDIDKISEYLKLLKDNNVPVLWRPLHEAAGGWFWWGASGAKAYKELWDIVYERMSVHHDLNNLIWVANSQSAKWYVGDDKCDMVGDDPYYDYNKRSAYLKDQSNSKRFKKTYAYAQNKMIAMSENDFVPNIDTAFDENVKWLFFCTWCREFVCEYLTDANGNKVLSPNYSEKCTTKAELSKVYKDERVWTLKKLNASGLYRN